jgi:hypothetical protein
MIMQLMGILMIVICVGLPLALTWRLWRLDQPTRSGWLIVVGETLAFIAFIFILGRWDVVGHYTRFILLALLAVALARSWRRHSARPWKTPEGPGVWRGQWTNILSLVAFGGASVYLGAGLFVRDDPQEFAFPLRGGTFVVGQGGSRTLLNHHFSHPKQRHAADILALNPAGFRAAGLHPSRLDRYAIWGADVVSPCDGTVVDLRDGLPDQSPPRMDPENAAGNHVVLDCAGTRVELAHFRRGSILVAEGQRIATGDAIGEVGNSGNSSEPHLHMHAVDGRTGEPVQMSFDGKLAVRNSVFRR